VRGTSTISCYCKNWSTNTSLSNSFELLRIFIFVPSLQELYTLWLFCLTLFAKQLSRSCEASCVRFSPIVGLTSFDINNSCLRRTGANAKQLAFAPLGCSACFFKTELFSLFFAWVSFEKTGFFELSTEFYVMNDQGSCNAVTKSLSLC